MTMNFGTSWDSRLGPPPPWWNPADTRTRHPQTGVPISEHPQGLSLIPGSDPNSLNFYDPLSGEIVYYNGQLVGGLGAAPVLGMPQLSQAQPIGSPGPINPALPPEDRFQKPPEPSNPALPPGDRFQKPPEPGVSPPGQPRGELPGQRITGGGNPYLGFLEEEPKAAYYSYANQWGPGRRQQEYNRGRYSDIYNEYLGSLGGQARAGQMPTGTWNDFLGAHNWNQGYQESLPYGARNPKDNPYARRMDLWR